MTFRYKQAVQRLMADPHDYDEPGPIEDEPDKPPIPGVLLDGSDLWRHWPDEGELATTSVCPGCFERDHPGYAAPAGTAILVPCSVHQDWGKE